MIKSIISYHRLMRISSLKDTNSTKIILLSVLVSPIIGDSLWIPVLICIATLFKIRKINFETPSILRLAPLTRREIFLGWLFQGFILFLALTIGALVNRFLFQWLPDHHGISPIIYSLLYISFHCLFGLSLCLMVTTINNGIIRFLFYSLILGLLFFLRFAMGSADGDFTMVLDIASFIIQSKSPALRTLCMGFLSIITFLTSIIVFSRKTSSF